MTLWAVWFEDHIHTDIHGQYAIFRNREKARRWMEKYGIPGCRVARLVVIT